MKLRQIKLLCEDETPKQVPEAPPGKILIAWYVEREMRNGVKRHDIVTDRFRERLLNAAGPLADTKTASQIRLDAYKKSYDWPPSMIIIKHERYTQGRHGHRANHFVRKVPVERIDPNDYGKTKYVVDAEVFLKKYNEVLEEVSSSHERKSSRQELMAARVSEMQRRYPDLHVTPGDSHITISNDRNHVIQFRPFSDETTNMTIYLPQSKLPQVIRLLQEQNETPHTE